MILTCPACYGLKTHKMKQVLPNIDLCEHCKGEGTVEVDEDPKIILPILNHLIGDASRGAMQVAIALGILYNQEDRLDVRKLAAAAQHLTTVYEELEAARMELVTATEFERGAN